MVVKLSSCKISYLLWCFELAHSLGWPTHPGITLEWEWLSQVHRALKTFNDLTNLVSISRPQISLTIPIYYALQDLLEDTALVGYDDDIANAVRVGIKKYQKYYDFMDNSEAYYTALILDPQVKCDTIMR